MDISKLDIIINKINTNPDVVTNDVIKTIRTCSAENLMESLRKNDNITGMTLLSLCYENSEIRKNLNILGNELIKLGFKYYKNKSMSVEDLNQFMKYMFNDIDIKFDDSTMKEFKEQVGKDKLFLFLEYLPSEEQTDELLQERIDYMIERNAYEIPKLVGKSRISIYKFDFIWNLVKENSNSIIDKNTLIEEIWKEAREKDVEKLEFLLKRCADYDLNYENMLHGTNPKDQESVRLLFQKYYSNKDESEIEEKFKKYYELQKISNDLYKNFRLDFLDEKYDFFSLEQLVRINNSSDKVGTFIIKHMDNNNWATIIEDIAKEDGCLEKLTTLNDNSNNYFDIGTMNPLEMAINDDSVLSKRIIEIMLKDPNNVFSIYTIEDVDNYEKKRKEISFKILEGKNEDFGKNINEMPIENRKRFALLELLYGIDYDQAENLIKKYGENINELKTDSAKEESLKQYIIQLKYIMNLDDKTIDQMMKNEEFKSFLQNAEIPEIASSITIQKDIVKLYEKAFNEKIAKSSIPKKDSIVFEGKEIPIEIYSPIDENGNFTYTEFATFIRQEGAYVNWENQDNYADYFNTQSALEHGNCESFINQSQIATANCSGGPKSGYDHTGDITMMAAWDIGSSTANEKSSSISSSWKTNNGIEFRTPDEFINYTRHGHNESVSDRIQRITERGIEKRRPGKAVFIKERYNETEDELGEIRASEWTEDRKMAKEMGSKISIIDREGFAIQEEMTIQYDLEMLGGPKVEELAGIKDIERLTGKKCQKVDWSQKADLSHEELIREIIVRFENNAIGMMYSDIKDEYFTDEKREYVVNALMKTIEKEREVDINQYYKDLETVERVIEEEKNKEVTNNGSRVYIAPKIYMEVAHRINTILVQDKKREDIFQIENKKDLRKIIDFIYDSKIYDDNKLHSTDHIVKTTLFANILAQNEGLSEREKNLIVTAAALHDSGREGNDGNKPHATLSAEKAKKILADENNIFKSKDFTEDEIKIIQAVIEYHEVKEAKKGKIKMETSSYPQDETDYGLNYFMQKYGLSKDNLPTVAKLCGILKDADALDRERFSGLESSTNTSFLHTKTAKDIRTLVFADRINNQTASRLLGKYYDYNSADINAVKKLKDKRVEKKSTTNQRLSKEEMYNLFSEMGIDLESDRSINFIRKQYDEEIIGTEDVQSAVNYIKQEYEKLITERMTEGDKGESGR